MRKEYQEGNKLYYWASGYVWGAGIVWVITAITFTYIMNP